MASYHHHITKQLAPLIKQAETQKWKFLLSNHWMIHVPLLIVTGRVMGNHPCQGFKAESPWESCGKHFLRTYMPWVMKQCFLNSRLHDVIVVQGFYVCQVSFWQNLIVKIKHVASKFANASPTSLFYTDEHINFSWLPILFVDPKAKSGTLTYTENTPFWVGFHAKYLSHTRWLTRFWRSYRFWRILGHVSVQIFQQPPAKCGLLEPCDKLHKPSSTLAFSPGSTPTAQTYSSATVSILKCCCWG